MFNTSSPLTVVLAFLVEGDHARAIGALVDRGMSAKKAMTLVERLGDAMDDIAVACPAEV